MRIFAFLPVQAEYHENASLAREFDHGGLIYPAKPVEELVVNLENTFTVFFSRNELHAGSMVDFLQFLQGAQLKAVGCSEHGRNVMSYIIKFYALTRSIALFFAKSKNMDRSTRRQKQKLLKMRRRQ